MTDSITGVFALVAIIAAALAIICPALGKRITDDDKGDTLL